MAEAKIHPPSRSRIAEARAAGIAPRPLLVGLSGASAGLAISARLFADPLAADLQRLVRVPLEAFAREQSTLALHAAVDTPALRAAMSALAPLAQRLALCCVIVLACAAFGAVLAQGLVIAVPRRTQRGFSRVRPALEASCLAALFLLAACALHVTDALWLSAHELPGLLTRVSDRLALVLVALAVADAAFARARFFRALWLTRSELRAEQREAYGAPELRAARARVRRESAREAP